MSLRIALALGLALLVGCSGGAPGGAGPWQKAGESEQTTARDNAQCRESAREEALRRYPYRGSPSLGATGAIVSYQQDDTGRAIVEESQFNTCMQGRGYQHASSGK